MSHIATQRIKKNGTYYAAGDPITLNSDDLAELPEGAVREAEPEEAVADGAADLTDAERQAALKSAVNELPDDAFKQDGEIRAAALRELNETLGFEVTAEGVAEAKTVSGE